MQGNTHEVCSLLVRLTPQLHTAFALTPSILQGKHCQVALPGPPGTLCCCHERRITTQQDVDCADNVVPVAPANKSRVRCLLCMLDKQGCMLSRCRRVLLGCWPVAHPRSTQSAFATGWPPGGGLTTGAGAGLTGGFTGAGGLTGGLTGAGAVVVILYRLVASEPPQEPTASPCHQQGELQLLAVPCFLAASSSLPVTHRRQQRVLALDVVGSDAEH